MRASTWGGGGGEGRGKAPFHLGRRKPRDRGVGISVFPSGIQKGGGGGGAVGFQLEQTPPTQAAVIIQYSLI